MTGTPLSVLAVAAGAFAYGAITVGGRFFAARGFSLYEIALTGVMFGLLALAPVVALRPELRPQRRDAGIFLAYGLSGTALQLGQFSGIVLGVPVAIVALLLYTQPLWTVVLGRLLLNEPITARKLASLGLAGLGIVLLLAPWESARDISWFGITGSLVAGVMLSLWIIIARISALRGNHPVTTSIGYFGSTTTALLLAWPLLSQVPALAQYTRLDPSIYALNWGAVALYTVFVNVGPNLLVIRGMRDVDASTGGMLLLLEPVAAAMMAWFLFGETLDGYVWLGGAFILGSNAVLVLRRRPAGQLPEGA